MPKGDQLFFTVTVPNDPSELQLSKSQIWHLFSEIFCFHIDIAVLIYMCWAYVIAVACCLLCWAEGLCCTSIQLSKNNGDKRKCIIKVYNRRSDYKNCGISGGKLKTEQSLQKKASNFFVWH